MRQRIGIFQQAIAAGPLIVGRIFEPITQAKAGNLRRLLIMDGHNCHITANVITYCMKNSINIVIMPLHCSHMLQPLDVGVFVPLKRALASLTDAASQLSSQRMTRIDWVITYMKAREQAMTPRNILAGWTGAGLSPLNPALVLN